MPKSSLPALPLLVVSLLVLLGCAHDSVPAVDDEGGPQAIAIRGELSYLPRVALPPDAVAVVELRAGPAPSGEVIAERRLPLNGRQVPVAFELEVDPAALRPGRVHVFRGFLRSNGDLDWVSEPLAIDTAAAVHRLGTLLLERQQAPRVARDPADAAPAMVARGNEPGWRLDLDSETLTLSWDYGAGELAAVTPEPVVAESVMSYGTRIGDRRLGIAVHDQRCADDMTGMPHPKRVIVSLDDRVLRGCGGEPRDLLLGEWVIEDVDGRGIVDASRATVVFDTEGRVGGRGSCNSYGGSYSLSGEGLAVSGIFSTMMACVESLMNQEQRIFAILEAVGRFEVDDTGALILHAHDGRTITARR
ncbi:MAG: META domain-containing protein [Gammaproteobacteria bacterium]|nr:META domain-containing protein [Gammaproteobacteria bacterium]